MKSICCNISNKPLTTNVNYKTVMELSQRFVIYCIYIQNTYVDFIYGENGTRDTKLYIRKLNKKEMYALHMPCAPKAETALNSEEGYVVTQVEGQ